jgi:hypothetical protein
VAHVENTVMDVYYRNDSMKSERRELLVGLLDWIVWAGFGTHKVA